MIISQILIIDDSEDIRKALKEILATDFKAEVHEAISGFSAIEMIKIKKFDVLVCDLKMMDGSGVDVHSYLVQHQPDLISKLIFFTGDTQSLSRTKISYFRVVDKFNYSDLFLALTEAGVCARDSE